jgi:hypothetical protein
MLDAVLNDLARTAQLIPRVEDRQWSNYPSQETAMVFAADGTGQGVSILTTLSPPSQLAGLADQVQEWAVEELNRQARPAVWPECPVHPNTHPLAPVVLEDTALWRCPKSRTVVAAIGTLER